MTVEKYEGKNPIEEVLGKLSTAEISMLMQAFSVAAKESRTRLHYEASGPLGVRSASAATKSGITGVQGETRSCYSCGKVGHLSKICPRPPKEKETGGRGQSGGYGSGCDGCRGGSTEGYRANLTVVKEEKKTGPVFSKDNYEMMKLLEKKQRLASDGGKKVTTPRAFTSSRDNITG